MCPNWQKHHGTVEPRRSGGGRTWDKLQSCDSVTCTAVRHKAQAQSRWPGEGRGRMDDQRPCGRDLEVCSVSDFENVMDVGSW